MSANVCNWSTTQGDVDQGLYAIIGIAKSEVVDESQ